MKRTAFAVAALNERFEREALGLAGLGRLICETHGVLHPCRKSRFGKVLARQDDKRSAAEPTETTGDCDGSFDAPCPGCR